MPGNGTGRAGQWNGACRAIGRSVPGNRTGLRVIRERSMQGQHTKRPDKLVWNVLACGCPRDHQHDNYTECPVAVFAKYAELLEEDDNAFFNGTDKHSLAAQKTPERMKKHLTEDGQRAPRGFWRVVSRDEQRYLHYTMGVHAIGDVFGEWAEHCGVLREGANITSNWARKTMCTIGMKVMKIPMRDIMENSHHESEKNFMKYVMSLLYRNPRDAQLYSRTLNNYVTDRFSPPSANSQQELLMLILEAVQNLQH